MSVFTVSIVDQTFDKKSAEVAYLRRVLAEVAQDIGRNQGTTTSGTVKSVNAAGVANSTVATWTYTPSGSNA